MYPVRVRCPPNERPVGSSNKGHSRSGQSEMQWNGIPSFACSAPEPERNRRFDSMRPHSREVSYAGCTEKSELEALLEKTRTSAKSSDSTTEVGNVRALMISVPRRLRRQLGVCVGGLATSTECGNWTSASCPAGGPGSSTPPSAEARRPRGRLKDQGRVRGFRGPRRMGYCATWDDRCGALRHHSKSGGTPWRRPLLRRRMPRTSCAFRDWQRHAIMRPWNMRVPGRARPYGHALTHRWRNSAVSNSGRTRSLSFAVHRFLCGCGWKRGHRPNQTLGRQAMRGRTGML